MIKHGLIACALVLVLVTARAQHPEYNYHHEPPPKQTFPAIEPYTESPHIIYWRISAPEVLTRPPVFPVRRCQSYTKSCACGSSPLRSHERRTSNFER